MYACSSTLIARRRARMLVWLYARCIPVGLRGKINNRVYVYFDTLPHKCAFLNYDWKDKYITITIKIQIANLFVFVIVEEHEFYLVTQ